MLKTETSTGFVVEWDNNDWDIVDALMEAKDDVAAINVVKTLILGKEQYQALRETCRDAETGKVRADLMLQCIKEILESKDLKN